uniref:Uncharacterized protein n=1 Tax=Ixodes ricinus TaxID=34613 RepID=A0A6B0UW29_IXORI
MNTTILFLGGFETSATALSFITYALGKHPDVQEKVRQEVKEVLNEGGSLDYETVTKKLKYVTQVIDEAMRIWPAGLTFSEENVGRIPKLAFQPFGMGPRNCLGIRLAYVELAYTVARMTQHFRWELGESQKGEMPFGQYGMVSTPGRGPWIVFHRL